jgi:hypothetical protein
VTQYGNQNSRLLDHDERGQGNSYDNAEVFSPVAKEYFQGYAVHVHFFPVRGKIRRSISGEASIGRINSTFPGASSMMRAGPAGAACLRLSRRAGLSSTSARGKRGHLELSHPAPQFPVFLQQLGLPPHEFQHLRLQHLGALPDGMGDGEGNNGISRLPLFFPTTGVTSWMRCIPETGPV